MKARGRGEGEGEGEREKERERERERGVEEGPSMHTDLAHLRTPYMKHV